MKKKMTQSVSIHGLYSQIKSDSRNPQYILKK